MWPAGSTHLVTEWEHYCEDFHVWSTLWGQYWENILWQHYIEGSVVRALCGNIVVRASLVWTADQLTPTGIWLCAGVKDTVAHLRKFFTEHSEFELDTSRLELWVVFSALLYHVIKVTWQTQIALLHLLMGAAIWLHAVKHLLYRRQNRVPFWETACMCIKSGDSSVSTAVHTTPKAWKTLADNLSVTSTCQPSTLPLLSNSNYTSSNHTSCASFTQSLV